MNFHDDPQIWTNTWVQVYTAISGQGKMFKEHIDK